MANDLFLDEMREDYILKRMVYVNSANHGYSEILLDEHLAMFADNNAGKTASLAGTKLLLYPEVNFNQCESKFKFEGKSGLFSKEDSYEFYFPDARSFVALEVQNPEGKFVMVLYKMNNYQYGRFFVPVAYEVMRPLFWNEAANTFAEDFSVQALAKFAREHDGIQVNERKVLIELMYEGFRHEKSKKRFCVLPLKDANTESIAAFSNIYQLAFDNTNTETQSLPQAIATLVEMGRGRAEEKVDADLTRINEDHATLVEKQNWLQALQNAKPRYERVRDSFAQIETDYEAYSIAYYTLENLLGKRQEEHVPLYQEASTHVDELRELDRTLTDQAKELDGQAKDAGTTIKNFSTQLTMKEAERLKTIEIISSYGSSKSNKDIIEELQDFIAEQTKEHEELKEENGIKLSLERVIREKNLLIGKLADVNTLIANTKLSFLDQLDQQAASALLSINRNFNGVVVSLTNEQKATINAFAGLFATDESNNLTFLGKPFGTQFRSYDARASAKAREQEKQDYEGQLSGCEKSIKSKMEELAKGKHANPEKMMAKCMENIKGAEEDISLVYGLEKLKKEIAYFEQIIAANIGKQKVVGEQLAEIQEQQRKAKGDFNHWYAKLKELDCQKELFSIVTSSLGRVRHVFQPREMTAAEVDALELPPMLSKELVNELDGLATTYSKNHQTFTGELRQLMTIITHPDVDLFMDYRTTEDFARIVKAYEHTFTTLDYDMAQLLTEVRAHNQFVGNQLSELRDAKLYLMNFINDINKELNDKHVSNLSEIKLVLKTNPSFEQMLSTLDKVNIQDDSMLDDKFYLTLAQFVEAYFNKKTRRLKMHDIISSIKYNYVLAETGEMVTKSQSGGTTSTITAFVLSVLLKRVTPDYVALRMPIIVDEISTLDFKNTSATILQIAKHGFSIFCATPAFSSFIAQKVGRWVQIDHVKVQAPQVSKCHMNILPWDVQAFGEIPDEA
ncbi:hypothetical protein ACSZMV_07995 [Aeromonas veronii]